MGRGFFIWASSVLLGCTLLLPPAASASTEFEMQLPQVLLEGIAYDLTVRHQSHDVRLALPPPGFGRRPSAGHLDWECFASIGPQLAPSSPSFAQQQPS